MAVACALAAAPAAAQAPTSPEALSFQAALDLAAAQNLQVAAVRRERAVREGGVTTAGLIPNPGVAFEATRDAPHQVLTFDVPVEIGSRRSRRLDLAREELLLADVDLNVELNRVRAGVRRAFYALLAADRRLQIATDLLAIAERFGDAAQARFEAGASPRLDVMGAELGVTRAQTDLDLATSARAAAQANLNAVLNRPPTQALEVRGEMADHTEAPEFEQALALAHASNGDVAVLDRQITIEERRVELLKTERTPTPIFSVGGVFNAPDEFRAGPSAGVSVELPLFSRNQGEIASSAATVARLQIERQAALRTVENSVFAALARIDAERRRASAYEQRLVPTAIDLEALTEESYQAGRSPLISVLDAQRSLRDMRLEALQAALDLQLSLADLEEILGTAID